METATQNNDLPWYTRLLRDSAFQQIAILTGWIVLGTVIATYVNPGGAMTNTLGAAITAVLLVTLIGLPISYMMNKLTYHSRAMRAGGGIMGWLFGPLVTLYIVVQAIMSALTGQAKVPYFGMFPLFEASAPSPDSGTWTKAFHFLWDEITRMFVVDIGPDVNLARPLLAAYWEPDGKKAVPESIYAQARNLAARVVTDMEQADALVGDARQKKEKELAESRASARAALGQELQRFINGA